MILAVADSSDKSASNLTFMMASLVTIGVICALAAIPVIRAKRRRFGQIEGLTAIMVLWALLTAASVIYYVRLENAFEREYTMRIMQNYDARDMSDRPAVPWYEWGFLAIAYGGAVLWSVTAKTASRRGFPLDTATPDEKTRP